MEALIQPAADGPLARYRALLAEGRLKPDPAQAAAAEKLEGLARALAGYDPTRAGGGWLARLGLGAKDAPRLAWIPGDDPATGPRQGLYICGDVGRGKSMLMDLFFAAAPVAAKRRVHFHAFMQDVHARAHRWHQANDGRRPQDDGLIDHLAGAIADEAWLLCFDELQVSDIGDAMILGRLFEALFARGVVVVTTSNRPPDDLYKYGLQRERFLPFIALLKERLDLLHLDSRGDYRLGRKAGMTVYFTPLDSAADSAMTRCFAHLTAGAVPSADVIEVQGRKLPVPRAAAGVAWFTFDELCRTPLGAADYLAIAGLFHTVMLSDLPALSPSDRDAAKRFVTLIDALYEHRTMLVCSAAAPPDHLYVDGDGAFEFHRTVSRMKEMQSEDYISHPHLT